MYIHRCIYIYIYTCIQIYIYVYTYVYVHTHTHTHTHNRAESHMSRRPAVLCALASFVLLPAAAANADDAVQLEKLKKEAARITGLIETTKKASMPDAPSLKTGVSVKTGAEVKVPQAVSALRPAGPTPDNTREPKEVCGCIVGVRG